MKKVLDVFLILPIVKYRNLENVHIISHHINVTPRGNLPLINQKKRKIPQILIHTKSMYRVFKRGFSFLKLNRFTVENFPKLN